MATRDELVRLIANAAGHMGASAGLGDVFEHKSGQRRISLTVILSSGVQTNLTSHDYTYTMFVSPAKQGRYRWAEWHHGTSYIGNSGAGFTEGAIPAPVLEIADLFKEEMNVKLIIGP